VEVHVTSLLARSAGLLPDRPELSPARRRLFEGALKLFSAVGYHGVSVRDIARELDQHATAIYAHVGSKQELLFEIVKMGDQELRDRVRLALLDTDRDPVEQLRAIVATNATTHLTFPELARVSHEGYGCLSAEQQAVIDVLRKDLGALLRDVAQRGIDQGAFDPADLRISLMAITAMGVRVVDWWTPAAGMSIKHVAATHADLALRMMTREK
jgi:AcrR family transcriptional regulator